MAIVTKDVQVDRYDNGSQALLINKTQKQTKTPRGFAIIPLVKIKTTID